MCLILSRFRRNDNLADLWSLIVTLSAVNIVLCVTGFMDVVAAEQPMTSRHVTSRDKLRQR